MGGRLDGALHMLGSMDKELRSAFERLSVSPDGKLLESAWRAQLDGDYRALTGVNLSDSPSESGRIQGHAEAIREIVDMLEAARLPDRKPEHEDVDPHGGGHIDI